MSPDQSLQLLMQLLWKAAAISAPILIVLLLVGISVSVLQVVTQVQEMSLTFVPKLVAAIVVLATVGPWMLRELVSYSTQLISDIPRYI